MSLFTEKFEALKKTLKAEWHIEGDRAEFLIDDIPYDVSFEEATGNLMVYSCLAEIPEDTDLSARAALLASVCLRLLKAQYCFSESGGFSFGADPEARMINLQALLPLEKLSDDEFFRQIEKFVQLANVWSARLKSAIENQLKQRDSSCASTVPAADDASFIVMG